MVLILNKEQVVEVLDFESLVGGVERSLVDLSQGKSINPNRLRIFVPDESSMLACMPAYLGSERVLGAKIVGSSSKPAPPGYPRQVSTIVVLLDAQGNFLSVMSAAYLGPMRTAAASAVATRHLARSDATSIAMIGCGVQARFELLGATTVRDIRHVFAYDINMDMAEKFAQEMRELHGIPVTISKSAEDAVAMADIVTLATTSAKPVVDGAAIRPRTHINAVGAHTPRMREMDTKTVVNSRFFVEYRHAILNEAGDILIPIEEGAINQSHILGEIGEVASHKCEGRVSPSDVTIFKSTGIAIEDVVAAKLAYDCAVAKGIGYKADL